MGARLLSHLQTAPPGLLGSMVERGELAQGRPALRGRQVRQARHLKMRNPARAPERGWTGSPIDSPGPPVRVRECACPHVRIAAARMELSFPLFTHMLLHGQPFFGRRMPTKWSICEAIARSLSISRRDRMHYKSLLAAAGFAAAVAGVAWI